MSFSRVIRANAEHYLLRDAQDEVARRYGVATLPPGRGAREWFFSKVFTPAYRHLPWAVRSSVIRAMPGSHRREWHPRERKTRPPAV